jgi:hypothetical protein
MSRIAGGATVWIGSIVLALGLGLGLGACGGTESKPVDPAAARTSGTGGAIDERFVASLREAADAYAAWGRVDERPNMAPELCAAPAPRDPNEGVRLSSAGDGSPHGRKLYYLYAKDRAAYLALGAGAGAGAALPVGFTVVKEAFAPRSATKDEVAAARHGFIEHDGAFLVPDARAGLFIMTKVGDAAESGTDEGWIYGTVAANGAVTSAGQVASCMGCHVGEATHERLFGVR